MSWFLKLAHSLSTQVVGLLLAIVTLLSGTMGVELRADELGELVKLQKQVRSLQAQGKYREAIRLAEQIVQRAENGFAHRPMEIANTLNDLANVNYLQGRYTEAEPLYKRSLAIYEKTLGAEDTGVADSLNNLANIYSSQGRYAEAAPLFKRALEIYEKKMGAEHPYCAISLCNLADVHKRQARYAEAEPLYKRALAIQEKTLGAEHRDVAHSLDDIATLYRDQHRYAEAETLHKRSLAIREKVLGTEHPEVAVSLKGVVAVYITQGRYAEAESLLKRSLAIREKTLGAEHPDVADSLSWLAYLYGIQGRYMETETLLDREIAMLDPLQFSSSMRSGAYSLRAQVRWQLDRKVAAITDLKHALDMAEQARTQTSGAEQERAVNFGQFTDAFERMVTWQSELGDVDEAVQAIQRSRARSLIDGMRLSGVDLNVGRPQNDLLQLRQRETELRSRIAQLEQQAELESKGKAFQSDSPTATALSSARAQLYAHYRDERSSSPVYHNLLSVGAELPRLSQLQQRLVSEGNLLLLYLLGEENSYVIVVGPDAARIERLIVSDEAAKTLGITPGPLTAAQLEAVLVTSEQTGLLQQLANPAHAVTAQPKLAALWPVLIPETERGLLLDGKVNRLIVTPDGPLSLLPLETLVVEAGESPRYLLDLDTVIHYAPSATVLYNLTELPQVPTPKDLKPVLTVGDPVYPTPASQQVASRSTLDELTSRARYSGNGGHLSRLPYSAVESQWVSANFAEQGIATGKLLAQDATEAKVRFNVPGRRIIHFACHGLTDQSYGNFFGALALTPGPKGNDDPSDDGFMTLPEIYQLDLKGCELVILSACETNFGPQQKGEGTWAMSRGFLVAGARRVVASNWLVDDEAAASLISYFCGGLAQDEQNGHTADYAARLHAAKRWVRQQDKWSSPYYWGTFVLVGPQ